MAHLRWKKDVAYIVDKSGVKDRSIRIGAIPVRAAEKTLAKYNSDDTYLRLGFLGDSTITFGDLCDAYLQDAKRHKGAYTVTVEGGQLPIFRAKWGKRRAAEITANEADDLIHSKGYKPTTIRNKIVILCNIWAYGIRQGYFKENEMKKCRRPELEQLPPVVISEASIKAIIKHCDPRVRPILEVLRYTACRPGEALRLERRDIDFKSKTILFRHTKTKRSRVVPMAKKLVPILKAIAGHEDALFSGIDKHSLRHAFREAKKAARIKERAFLYAFRHFALTKFLEVSGGDLRAAQQFAGHSQIQTTIRYTHRPQEVLKRAVDKL